MLERASTCDACRSMSLIRYTSRVASFVKAVLEVCSRPIGLSCSTGMTPTCILHPLSRPCPVSADIRRLVKRNKVIRHVSGFQCASC